MSKKHMWYKSIWSFVHLDKDMNVKERWETENALADEGEQSMLDTYFRNQNSPTQFYLRLTKDTPVETDTLSTLTGLVSGNGYSAKLLQRTTTGFPGLSLVGGDYRVTAKIITFTASGGSIPITGQAQYAFISTTSDNTGKLIAFVALSQGRKLAAGESLQITIRATLQ